MNPNTETPLSIALIHMLTAKWTTHLLSAAVQLKIPEALSEGALTTDEIAARTGTTRAVMYRILRGLENIGVLDQSADREFALNELGKLLRPDVPDSVNHIVRMVGSPWHNRIWEALIKSARTGASGAEEAFGMTLWRYFDANPADLENFNEAMTEVSNTIGATAIEGYDFSGIGTLVDVGGGHGGLLSRVLRKHAKMRGIVFDRPSSEPGARVLFENQGISNRCEFVGGDFLASVPAGGDAYMMSHILHNWSDQHALTILRNCRSAMKPRTKILVFDVVIKPAGEKDWGKLMDLEMIAMFGGRERTTEEFRQMFQETGFTLNRVIWTPSTTGIVEGFAV